GRWAWPWASSRTRWKRCASRTSSGPGCWPAPPAAGWPRRPPGGTWGARRRVASWVPPPRRRTCSARGSMRTATPTRLTATPAGSREREPGDKIAWAACLAPRGPTEGQERVSCPGWWRRRRQSGPAAHDRGAVRDLLLPADPPPAEAPPGGAADPGQPERGGPRGHHRRVARHGRRARRPHRDPGDLRGRVRALRAGRDRPGGAARRAAGGPVGGGTRIGGPARQGLIGRGTEPTLTRPPRTAAGRPGVGVRRAVRP